MGKKLDTLLAVMKHMGEKLKGQDDRLWKQEERASIHDMSAIPFAQSSPYHSKWEATQQSGMPKPTQLFSFEVLKTDLRIQAEVAKRLHDYQDASWIEGKPPSSLKSGTFTAGVAKIRTHVNWAQDLCTMQPGSIHPTYDDLPNKQWVQWGLTVYS